MHLGVLPLLRVFPWNVESSILIFIMNLKIKYIIPCSIGHDINVNWTQYSFNKNLETALNEVHIHLKTFPQSIYILQKINIVAKK